MVHDSVAEGTVLKQTPQPNEIISEDHVKIELIIAKRSTSPRVLRYETVHYEVPQGGSEREIAVFIEDLEGEREVYRGKVEPGTKFSRKVQVLGKATAKIYMNDILIDEIPLEEP